MLEPVLLSVKVALIATFIAFFLGIGAAWIMTKKKLPGKNVWETMLILPMVLPPSIVGYLLLQLFGRRGPIGAFLMDTFGVQVVFTWVACVIAAVVVAFPLMYRTARGAFEGFDQTLKYSGQTLGLSNTYIFWRIQMPACKQGILAGMVLAFARALGEYGATSMFIGYVPGRTATISTTVYQLWRTNDEAGAFFWVMVNLVISTVVLLIVNMLERKSGKAGAK